MRKLAAAAVTIALLTAPAYAQFSAGGNPDEGKRTRLHVGSGAPYSDYRDAYRFGWESAGAGYESFDAAEKDLSSKWNHARGNSRLDWADAKDAVRDSWHRVERAIPGDADGDGR